MSKCSCATRTRREETTAGVRGVMACYRGCIKTVYVREVDEGVILLTRLPCSLIEYIYPNVPVVGVR